REAIQAMPDLESRLGLIPAVIAVAEAVAYAHSLDIIHRDLKPGNVMLGAYGETIVIDWGLAKYVGEAEPDQAPVVAALDTVTATGAIVGTPAYMPPEQARGEELDERADVYAIGAILHHLLVGAPPPPCMGASATATSPDSIDLVQPRAPR